VAESFKEVVSTPEYMPILEIKVTQVKETYLVLATSETKLYQFLGKESLRDTLSKYAGDVKKIQNHAIVISGKANQKQNDKKDSYRTASDTGNQV
jgi:hypothetical protein